MNSEIYICPNTHKILNPLKITLRRGKEEEIAILKRRMSEIAEERNRTDEQRKSAETRANQLRNQNQQRERQANEFQFQLEKLNDRIQQVDTLGEHTFHRYNISEIWRNIAFAKI